MHIPKKQKLFLALSFVLLSLISFGCNKQEYPPAATQQSPAKKNSNGGSGSAAMTAPASFAGAKPYVFERIPVQHRINPTDGKLPPLPFRTGAHREHLNDPLVFRNLPDGGVPNGPTVVVGSDLCLFYPVETISSEAELARLPKGEAIPFASIIPLGDKLENSDGDKANMFEIEDNLNFFYKTTWNGKRGIVFGADLYGIGASNENNRISALLYKDSGYFGNFYPFTGYEKIGANIQKELETKGLAFQEVKPSEYTLSLEGLPDDMISLYVPLTGKNRPPIFVTTDLAAHANHLVFDRTLQYVEENYFFSTMVTLTDEYINAIERQKERIPEKVYTTSLLYFKTAQALLALAPSRVKGSDYYSTVEYRDVDTGEVLQNYPPEVQAEIEKMTRAAGLDTSSIFTFGAGQSLMEDYSQYKVRGHYTKNGVLGAYFRALMWYGRINFTLGSEGGNTGGAALQLAPIALFIADLTENSPELKQLWQSLFDPITEIIGASDDIGFYELLPLWNKVKGAGFAQWYKDPKNIETFISQNHKELRSPAISGSSLFLGTYAGGPAPEERLPPKGWRLFGQRYTPDSEIHHWVSPPRLLYRNMVRGLDILKVFGSKTADRLLRESDFIDPAMPGPQLEAALNSLQKNLAGVQDDFWLSTYYTNILYQIKTQALFENGAGFYFTEQPGWNLKAMNAAHGTWAELRHDTILYAKQSYAENAGGGDWKPTFRTKPLPEPIHYIEPNVPFWITSAIGMQKLYTILEKYDYLDGRTAQVLAGMHDLFVKAAEISRQEADNKEVSATDLQWIGKFAAQLAILVKTHIDGAYSDDENALRMALVADVFTNAETGLVLETAVGIPYRLYIPLNDRQGGKRIAMGYGFSYYEWSQPMSNRLNNEQWKEMVYGNTDMKKYLPFWMRENVAPAK